MNKQHWSILTILLANTFFLLVNIIPHHHHEYKTLCLDFSHCEHDGTNKTEHDHEHDGQICHHTCFLQQLIAAPQTQVKIESGFYWSHNDVKHIHTTILSSYKNNSSLTYIFIKDFEKHTVIQNLLLSNNKGLREPPIA